MLTYGVVECGGGGGISSCPSSKLVEEAGNKDN
jgi:hypothetical protein